MNKEIENYKIDKTTTLIKRTKDNRSSTDKYRSSVIKNLTILDELLKDANKFNK
ncbi:hypothetical protein [Fictibacillus sp. JL2B1089]|uniref:hypothetical protein n=1 Tax=Fictibacillus sp. JL2B1089 TaxID=3399565 RepID=UPI003A898A82